MYCHVDVRTIIEHFDFNLLLRYYYSVNIYVFVFFFTLFTFQKTNEYSLLQNIIIGHLLRHFAYYSKTSGKAAFFDRLMSRLCHCTSRTYSSVEVVTNGFYFY